MRALLLRVALLGACALGASLLGACSTSSAGSTGAAPTLSSLPAGAAACGKRITGDISSDTSNNPSVRVSISKVISARDGITVTLQIGETRHGQTLSLPIVPVPPTAVILVNGEVAAYEPVPASPSVNPLNALGVHLDKGPYLESHRISALCPGHSWKKLTTPGTGGTAVVYLSRPSNSVPDATRLLGATRRL